VPVKIQATPNGPLKVEGDFTVQKADGSLAPHKDQTAYLCRCGQSTNQPFCDGSHKKAELRGE
jgi:CDGSH-type Zn-finger protein